MGTRGFARRLQRVAGWCKAAGRSGDCITPEPRTEGIFRRLRRERPLLRIRVPVHRRNKSGTAEVYAPLSLILRGKGAFLIDN